MCHTPPQLTPHLTLSAHLIPLCHAHLSIYHARSIACSLHMSHPHLYTPLTCTPAHTLTCTHPSPVHTPHLPLPVHTPHLPLPVHTPHLPSPLHTPHLPSPSLLTDPFRNGMVPIQNITLESFTFTSGALGSGWMWWWMTSSPPRMESWYSPSPTTRMNSGEHWWRRLMQSV